MMFLGKPLRFMSLKLECLLMNVLKSTITYKGGFMKVEFSFFIESSITISWTMFIVSLMSPNLGYKFSMNMIFMTLYNLKNGYTLLVIELDTHYLMLNCMFSCKGFFLYVSLAIIV